MITQLNDVQEKFNDYLRQSHDISAWCSFNLQIRLPVMLTQLKQLALDTEGRYATETELQFLKDYLKSADSRIQAYQNIRDNEETILDEIDTDTRAHQPDIFMIGQKNQQNTARRDSQYIIRHLAASHACEWSRNAIVMEFWCGIELLWVLKNWKAAHAPCESLNLES